MLLALEGRGLSAETPVREVWPGFPVVGARFSHLLSHQCGLAALDQKAGVLEHAEVVAAIESPLSPAVRQSLATPQSSGDDRVLLRSTTFTCGAQQDPLDKSGGKIRYIYGPSLAAFGHPGAGDSHALGDPATGISFAYVMNQMDLSVMPSVECLEMVDALFSEI